MEESYVEGDLGPLFNSAIPQTLPEVADLLRRRCGESFDPKSDASALVQSAYQQVNMMQETSCAEETVADLAALRLRLRMDGAGGGFIGGNAHLAGLEVDDNGNVVLPESGATGEAGSRQQRARLRPFEVVALATLTPRTVEEALVLVPSLARFEEEDLQEAIALLEQ